MAKRVLFIDGYNFAIRSWMGCPVVNDVKKHIGMIFGSLNSIREVVRTLVPQKVVICWDGPNAGIRRKQIFPEYKANRKKTWEPGQVRSYAYKTEKEQRESFDYQVSRVREYFDFLPVFQIRIPDMEADDVIAVGVDMENDLGNQSVICSTDKDFLQLVQNELVWRYNPITKKKTGKDEFEIERGYPAHNYIAVRSVEGDVSDNIEGVKKQCPKGPRRVTEHALLKSFPKLRNERYDVGRLIMEAEQIVESKPKGVTKSQLADLTAIVEQRDVIMRNYGLMQLSNPSMSKHVFKQIIDALSGPPSDFDRFSLRRAFMQDKIGSQTRNFDAWIQIFTPLALNL